jgi:hypothetical protein
MQGLRVTPKVAEKDITALVEIDRAVFGSEPTEMALQWAHHRPDMYTVLRFQEVPVAYGLVIPINAIAFNAIRDGTMHGDEVPLKHIVRSENAAGFYLASMACEPALPTEIGVRVRSRLVGYTQGPLLRTQQPIIGVAITPAGASLAKEIGMSERPYQGVMQGLNGFNPKVMFRNGQIFC